MNAFDFLVLLAFALCLFHTLNLIHHKLRNIMAKISDLDSAIANLSTDVDTFIAAQPQPVDVQPQVDAVNALDAKVKAATPAPVVP